MYPVVLLVEEALSHIDAAQITELHEAIDDVVHAYVLLPVEDAAARVESALGSIAASEVLATSTLAYPDVDPEQLQQEILDHARSQLGDCIEVLRSCGRKADGQVTSKEPVQALIDTVSEQSAEEVIIVTRPHIVTEFLHIDWTSKARRQLGVPILHLLEHQDPEPSADEPVTGN